MKRLSTRFKNYWFLALFLALPALPALAARAPWDNRSLFVVTVKEIEIGESLVRVKINQTLPAPANYSRCHENETAFGWSVKNPHHNDWLNIVKTAYLAKAPVKICPIVPGTGTHDVGMVVTMVGFAERL